MQSAARLSLPNLQEHLYKILGQGNVSSDDCLQMKTIVPAMLGSVYIYDRGINYLDFKFRGECDPRKQEVAFD